MRGAPAARHGRWAGIGRRPAGQPRARCQRSAQRAGSCSSAAEPSRAARGCINSTLGYELCGPGPQFPYTAAATPALAEFGGGHRWPACLPGSLRACLPGSRHQIPPWLHVAAPAGHSQPACRLAAAPDAAAAGAHAAAAPAAAAAAARRQILGERGAGSAAHDVRGHHRACGRGARRPAAAEAPAWLLARGCRRAPAAGQCTPLACEVDA